MKRNQTIRNIIIFVIGTFTLSGLAGILLAGKNSAGGLVLIIGPILMMVLLRSLGKDGWENAGLRLNFKNNIKWYLISVIIYPLTFLIVTLLSLLTGVASMEISFSSFFPLFVTGMAVPFLPAMIYAVCEEFGWRGYLDPQLALLKIPDVKRHLIVGLIWAVWHFPFILSTDYTKIPLQYFLPVFTIGLVVASFVYGQIRKYSRSVWPAVIMHGTANTIIFAIINNQLITFNSKLFAYLSHDSILTIVIWLFFSWLLLRHSASQKQTT
jgi:membrane protease YdiL (CAAX protease family)